MSNTSHGNPATKAVTLVAGSDGTNDLRLKTDSSGELQVDVLSIVPGTGATALGKAEDAAHASGDVGVMALGVRNDSAATLTGTDLDYSPIAVTRNGSVMITQGSILNGDAQSASQGAMVSAGGNTSLMGGVLSVYNGATYDRQRNNMAGTLLASAARTATTSSADQTNYNGQAVAVTVNVTAVPGVETVTPSIEAKDPVSGVYTTILTGAAISGTSTVRLRVGTNITAVANLAAADVLGRTWRITMTHSASGSFTYSVGYDVMTA